MKKYHFKYIAKLYFKQPRLIVYFLPSIFLLLIIGLCTTIDNMFQQQNLESFFARVTYIYLTILFCISAIVGWTISPKSKIKVVRVMHQLLRVIEANHFYHEVNGKIKYSLTIKFYFQNDELYVEVYPHGDKYSNKKSEISEILESALSLTVISVQNDYPDHTTYVLSRQTNNFVEATFNLTDAE